MRINTARGFTLIELVVVITILGIIAGIGSRIVLTSFVAYFDNRQIMDADAQARLALERMSRDIRAIRSSADISAATASTFTFTDTYGNSSAYSLSGTTLMHQANGGTAQALADGVKNLTLTYYTSSGATTTTLANIRSVAISLNITQNNTNFTISTAIYPPNLS